MVELSSDVMRWKRSGTLTDVHGRRVFLRDVGQGEPTPVLLLHGFPGSSYDWQGVAERLASTRRVLTMDLPGYGLSQKPAGGDYSLFAQADLVEAALEHWGIERCAVVAHDMGDTVTAELLSRGNTGTLSVGVEQVILTNGSIFIDLAELTRGQRLTLRLPDRRLPMSLPGFVLRRSLKESFTTECPPPPGAIENLIALNRLEGGDRLLPRLIRYIEERRLYQERWTAGLVDYPGPMSLLWGQHDPIAVPLMASRLTELRPATTIVPLRDVGHWPSIEAPELVAGEILRILDDPARE